MNTSSSLLTRLPRRKTTESLTKTIYDAMLRKIITGEIGQGEFLSELKLAEQFQASRTPVREACIHLYKEGLLRMAPNKGYVATEISLDEIRDLYQLRQILEPEAAALASATVVGPGVASAWANILENQSKVLNEERTYDTYLLLSDIEYRFHLSIAEAGGNRKLAKFVGEIMNQFRRFYYVCFRKSPWLDVSLDEHREIITAIEQRDTANARRLMYDHVTKGSERAIQLL